MNQTCHLTRIYFQLRVHLVINYFLCQAISDSGAAAGLKWEYLPLQFDIKRLHYDCNCHPNTISPTVIKDQKRSTRQERSQKSKHVSLLYPACIGIQYKCKNHSNVHTDEMYLCHMHSTQLSVYQQNHLFRRLSDTKDTTWNLNQIVECPSLTIVTMN